MLLKERLRMLRSESDAKQDEVAKALNISRASYSSYENGITPPMQTCIDLAKHFDVSLDYLLGLTKERKPAGGLLSSLLDILAQCVGEVAPTATDFAALVDAAIKYYRRGAPCGDTPLVALLGFITGLRSALVAAASGDGPALIDGANAAAVAALEVTKMPAALYESQKGDTSP